MREEVRTACPRCWGRIGHRTTITTDHCASLSMPPAACDEEMEGREGGMRRWEIQNQNL